ncbi:GNAT family protein [Ureibacillus sp. FSL W7-1570]|uniref:GNAT family N-acetyltransferase n=1 Tax=Ureibacillus sp. FSL W7-1570 TaxID=2954593 RepID=UPI00315AD2C7
MEHIILENDIVLLRPIESEDIEAIAEAAKDERIWEHMQVDLATKEAVEKYVGKAVQERKEQVSYVFVIIHKKTNRIVGCTSFLDLVLDHKRLEIGGTWLNPSVWRTPVNTNCKYLLLSYCFEQLQLNRVQLKTAHTNKKSQRAIERIGATKEGVLRNHIIRPNGTIRHTVMYSIIKEEWPAVKERFLHELL